jgi:hypothetical protein
MKKFAIGCLVVVVLLGIVGAGIAYYAFRQAQTMFSQFAELGQVPEIERSVRARGPYTPPASGELTPEQLDRLLRVQAQVRKQLGARFATMQQKYKALSEKENPTIADLPALMAAYRDLSEAWLAGKRTQVEALNEANLSLEEYRWIREQAYRALGTPYLDFDVGKLVDHIRSGSSGNIQPGELRGSIGPSGPESNRTLVEPVKKQLEENLALASFGL